MAPDSVKCGLQAALLMGLLCVSANLARAVPSDAQTIKDLTSPGVISVKLTSKGSKSWSKTYLQYFWERGAVVTRKAGIPEYPKATVDVVGIATYSIVGATYPFKKLYVSYNEYHGLPTPGSADVLKVLNADLPKFLGNSYNSIVGDIEPLALAANPKWYWGSANSVEFLVTTGYDEITSYETVEKKKVTFKVGMRRVKVTAPWTDFFASVDATTSLGIKKYSAEEVRAMKTLAGVAAEREANARLKALPDVEIPAFKSDLEAFDFINSLLREGNPGKVEAFVRRSLTPFYYDNSDVVLNARGEEVLKDALAVVTAKSNYAEQYAPDPNVREYQTNMMQYWNADGRHFSRIALQLAGGTWQDGVKVGQTYKISALELWVSKDADEIARLQSLSPAKRFAPPPGARSLSQIGQQVVVQQQAAVVETAAKAIVWTPFTSQNARLQVSLPGTPQETEGKSGDDPMWTIEATHPQVTCRAIAIIYPKNLNRMVAQTTVDATLKQLAADNGATIKQQGDVTGGTFGRVAVMESADQLIKARVFVQNQVLYQLIISGAPATMAAVNDRVFFNSFQAIR